MAEEEEKPIKAEIPVTPKTTTGKTKGRKTKKKRLPEAGRPTGIASYPRHSVKKALRIPKAILEQNAGKRAPTVRLQNLLGLLTTGHRVSKLAHRLNMDCSTDRQMEMLKSPNSLKDLAPSESERRIGRIATGRAQCTDDIKCVQALPRRKYPG